MIAAEGLPVQVACRVLGVSESGFYEQRKRPPSQRAIRHAMLTDLITQIHTQTHGIYGSRRIHAELTLGRGVTVGHDTSYLWAARAIGHPCSTTRRARRNRARGVRAALAWDMKTSWS